MDKIFVIARDGQICPRENRTGMIDSTAAVPVPNTRYYKRLIADGSLLRVQPREQPPATEPVAKRSKREDK